MVHIHAEGPAFFCWIPKLFGKRVISTIHGLDWAREKWKFGLGSKFIRQGEKNAVKYADEIIVLSKGVQKYFMDTYGRETHFIPNGVNRPEVREANLIKDHFGLEKDSYILFLGRLVPEKGIRYLVEAFKNVKTDKKLVIAGGSSDTDSFMTLLQQMALGVPILAADVPAIRDYCNCSNGVMSYKPYDSSDLAQKLVQMSNYSEDIMNAMAQDNMTATKTSLSEQEMARQFEIICNDIVGNINGICNTGTEINK